MISLTTITDNILTSKFHGTYFRLYDDPIKSYIIVSMNTSYTIHTKEP